MINGGELLGRLLSSVTKAELLTLFHRNPGLIDTADGVALRIGKKGNVILQDLTDLVSIGALATETLGRSKVYRLNRDKDEQIQDHVAGYVKNINKS